MSAMNRPAEPASAGLASSGVPHDIDAERRVLGILIKYPTKVDLVVDKLKEGHFYSPVNREIYRAILDLYREDGHISYTQVYNRLRKEKRIPAPDQALIELTECFVSKSELEPSLALLHEKYAKRRILEAVEQIEQMIQQESEDSVEAYQARAQELIFRATSLGDVGSGDVKDLADILSRCYTNLVERREGKGSYGLSVRYPAIDVLTTGFKRKDLIILAGRPSMGKTALALNFAVNVAKRQIPVLIFSLEMDDESVGDRLVIGEFFKLRNERGEFEITSWDYATKLDDRKLARANSIFSDLYKLPIKIVDKRGLTAAEIRAKARRVKAEIPDLGLIIIDYLQLIRPPSMETNRSWALIVGEAVRELRDLAGELDLPVILLSQLNRGVEARENKRPMMSDLRDSGNIEEFADVVMFVYRDEYYYPDQAKQRGTEGQAEVIIAKQRKGQTGKAILQFVPEFTKFVDVTLREES
ncbi:MAG: replicative DNA helicase [Syntrophothermus sp.]